MACNINVRCIINIVFLLDTESFYKAETTWTRHSDGLLYAMVTKKLSGTIARNTCANLPCFRLAVFSELGQKSVAKTISDKIGNY